MIVFVFVIFSKDELTDRTLPFSLILDGGRIISDIFGGGSGAARTGKSFLRVTDFLFFIRRFRATKRINMMMIIIKMIAHPTEIRAICHVCKPAKSRLPREWISN